MDHESTISGAPHPEDAHGRDALQALRERVSARMDGASPAAPSTDEDEDFAWLARDAEARDAWLDYHRIGDLLRSPAGTPLRDERAFLNRFHERLAAEPVQLAPQPSSAPCGASCGASRFAARRWSAWAGAVAAAVAGVAVVAALHAIPGGAGWGAGDARGRGKPAPLLAATGAAVVGTGAKGASSVASAASIAGVASPAAHAVAEGGAAQGAIVASARRAQGPRGPMPGGPLGATPSAHGLDTNVLVPRALLAHLTCTPPLHNHDPARLQLLR